MLTGTIIIDSTRSTGHFMSVISLHDSFGEDEKKLICKRKLRGASRVIWRKCEELQFVKQSSGNVLIRVIIVKELLSLTFEWSQAFG